MPDVEGEDEKFGVADFAKYPVVTYPVAPDSGAISREALASVAWVLQSGDIVEVIDDSAGD